MCYLIPLHITQAVWLLNINGVSLLQDDINPQLVQPTTFSLCCLYLYKKKRQKITTERRRFLINFSSGVGTKQNHIFSVTFPGSNGNSIFLTCWIMSSWHAIDRQLWAALHISIKQWLSLWLRGKWSKLTANTDKHLPPSHPLLLLWLHRVCLAQRFA